MLAAPAADPVTCLFGFCCAFTGIPACCTRKEALQQYGQYPADYVCCQGYVPKRCGMDFPNMCKGSELGMCLEVSAQGWLGRRSSRWAATTRIACARIACVSASQNPHPDPSTHPPLSHAHVIRGAAAP